MDVELGTESRVLRNGVKHHIGLAAMQLVPQARYIRTIFVLSHMRATSTALTNVLCTHPAINGYGETHVIHGASHGAGRLMVNIARRGAWSPLAGWQCDKILHNHLDQTPPQNFFHAHAIFLIRAPGPAIHSIQDLSCINNDLRLEKAEDAARYYTARLEHLHKLWTQFPKSNRIGVQSEALRQTPDQELARLSKWLNLSPALNNQYKHPKGANLDGAGDPTQSRKLCQIQNISNNDQIKIPSICQNLQKRCETSHNQICKEFQKNMFSN